MKTNPTRPAVLSRRIGSLGAAVATVVALCLAGCTSARDVGTPTASATPRDGGVMKIAIALDILPSNVFAPADRNNPWTNNVFEPLAHFDPKSRKLTPVLASKIDLAPDAKSVRIDLRKGVKFQNGDPLTTDAVEFAIQRSNIPANNLAFVAKNFAKVVATSDTSLRIDFTTPMTTTFYNWLDQTLIVDPSTYAGLADGSKVIGTGPFTFEEWRPGAGLTLKKSTTYRDAKDVHLDKIEYVVTTDPTAEINAVKSGRVQIAWGLTPSTIQAFAGDKKFATFDATTSNMAIGFNVTGQTVDDKEIRQAVAYAIDSKRINEQVFAGTGRITGGLPWVEGTAGVSKLEGRCSYQPSKAKKMVADAGGTGKQVVVTYNSSNPTIAAVYQIVANNMKAAGLDPVPDAKDQPSFIAQYSARAVPQMFINLAGQNGMDASTMIQSLTLLSSVSPTRMQTPEYVELSQQLAAATSPSDQKKAVVAMSEYMNDQVATFSIVQPPTTIVRSTATGGMRTYMKGQLDLQNAYLAK